MKKNSKKVNDNKEIETERDESKRIKDRLKELEILKNAGKIEELYKQALSIISQNLESEKMFYSANFKNESLTKELTSLNNSLGTLSDKIAILEKNNKFYVQKMNDLNEEKKKIISDEVNKRNDIIKKTEDYMREYQDTFENVIPEKEALMRENMMLKQKIEAYIQNTKAIKENVENQIKLKDQQNFMFEDELRNQIKTKMDEISKQNDKAVQENQELKNKNATYAKKFEEVNKNISNSNEIFTKMKEDIEKRNAKIILLDKENSELKNKEVLTESSINDISGKIEKAKKDRDLNKNKINALLNLQKMTLDKIKNLENLKNNNCENTEYLSKESNK